MPAFRISFHRGVDRAHGALLQRIGAPADNAWRLSPIRRGHGPLLP
jgi:hypothetical protein